MEVHLSKRNVVFSIALSGALAIMTGSSALAQYPNQERTANQYANRVVEGTVSSVAPDRNGGAHVRLTNGMDLFVPASITGVNQGRRYGASTLVPGDLVRMNVYSREGDGRDARVRSLEVLQSNNRNYRHRNNTLNNALMSGTVVAVDRRANTLVLKADDGQVTTIDLNTYGERGSMTNSLRRGDRISVSGRMNRGGVVIANDVRVDSTRQRY